MRIASKNHQIVIITALLPEEKKRHIGEQVRASGAAIKEWSCAEADLP